MCLPVLAAGAAVLGRQVRLDRQAQTGPQVRLVRPDLQARTPQSQARQDQPDQPARLDQRARIARSLVRLDQRVRLARTAPSLVRLGLLAQPGRQVQPARTLRSLGQQDRPGQRVQPDRRGRQVRPDHRGSITQASRTKRLTRRTTTLPDRISRLRVMCRTARCSAGGSR